MKTVVGKTGTKIPMMPIPISIQPAPISNQRNQICRAMVGAGMSVIFSLSALLGCMG